MIFIRLLNSLLFLTLINVSFGHSKQSEMFFAIGNGQPSGEYCAVKCVADDACFGFSTRSRELCFLYTKNEVFESPDMVHYVRESIKYETLQLLHAPEPDPCYVTGARLSSTGNPRMYFNFKNNPEIFASSFGEQSYIDGNAWYKQELSTYYGYPGVVGAVMSIDNKVLVFDGDNVGVLAFFSSWTLEPDYPKLTSALFGTHLTGPVVAAADDKDASNAFLYLIADGLIHKYSSLGAENHTYVKTFDITSNVPGNPFFPAPASPSPPPLSAVTEMEWSPDKDGVLFFMESNMYKLTLATRMWTYMGKVTC